MSASSPVEYESWSVEERDVVCSQGAMIGEIELVSEHECDWICSPESLFCRVVSTVTDCFRLMVEASLEGEER